MNGRSWLAGIFFLMLSGGLIACEGSHNRDVENYGDLVNSSGGIVLNEQKHIGGWGRKDCLLCHNAALNLHRDPNTTVNADSLNALIRNNGYSKYCMTCHGTNGVPQ
jgi:hypothetical protein